MKLNDYTVSLLSSSTANNNNYQSLESNSQHNSLIQMNDLQNNNKEEEAFASLNIHHSINNTDDDAEVGPFMSHHQYMDSQSPLIHQSSEEQLISKHNTAISMSNATQPTNTNVISALRHRASSNQAKARVDNVFLYSSIPKFGDMFLDYQTSAITLLHIGFAILTIILIIIGYLLQIDVVWKYGTFLCLLTNIFGITHSMYSGSISSKVSRLDAALQNFAIIIQKFAKALNIQEAYLGSVKNTLDFIDHHLLLIQHQHPEIDDILAYDNNNNNNKFVNHKEILKIYHQFVAKLKQQTINQHKKWLLTFFGTYKVLDNRFGITKGEYIDFISKLPNKSRTLFQSLTGIHTRFKQLDVSDELLMNENEVSIENTVLLYKDMTELVYKVLQDISTINKRIENELAEKMISKEKMINNNNEKDKNIILSPIAHVHPHPHSHTHSYILSQRMSVSLARDAPQVQISSPKNKNSTDETGAIKYERMRYVSEDDEDDIYNVPVNDRSNTLPVSGLAGLNKKHSSFATHPDLRKIKSYDANDMYTNVDFVKQRALSMDDDWLRKVMADLADDENYYDYSHSHKL